MYPRTPRWRRVAAVITSLSAVLVLLPSAASAAASGQPFYGDLTGDGHPDRITLGGLADGCVVFVQAGDSAGRFGVPVPHGFVPPENDRPAYCPDTGTAIDLGGDGRMELVLGWCCAPTVDYGLLVLRNFVPVATLPGLWESDVIELADFNGDRLTDLYVSTYFGGFQSYLNTASGSLVPGPISYPCADPRYLLADFDRNRRQDLLITCRDEPNAGQVVVLLDDGRRVTLQPVAPPGGGWEIEAVDVNADGRLDVRTWPAGGGTATVFLGRGDGTFATGPIANDDLAHARLGVPTVIKVRTNDIASSTATLTIVQQPKYGYLTNTDPRYEINYVRTVQYRWDDSFVYQLTEGGLSDTATVTVRFKD